jgi:hypothetical protein
VRAATAFSASVRAGSAGVAPDASVIVGIADEAVVDAGKAAERVRVSRSLRAYEIGITTHPRLQRLLFPRALVVNRQRT